mmetsp:Transcript_5585/g.8560  ORF Transcript_5585/g.8560 Transcript_5585/m.8560 type:complete len:546 (-) Transcript_5585:70-1707(-)
MENSNSTVGQVQVFQYDSEKPAFARKQAIVSTASTTTEPLLVNQYPEMVEYLESIERNERLKFFPRLTDRAPNLEIDDVVPPPDTTSPTPKDGDTVVVADKHNINNDNAQIASRRHEGLKEFSLQLLTTDIQIPPSLYYTNITTLDVSYNELSTLPGISSLSNLEVLCIKRNWFNQLPLEIGKLRNLRKIDASRNFLKPNMDSLRLKDLQQNLTNLQILDVSLNQKCRTADHRNYIQKCLLPLEVKVSVTVWQEASNGEHNCIGSSAAERDATLLRSQLESWGTVNLRRRLVRDFGQEPTDPKLVDRAEVMERLLRCYQMEGLLHFGDNHNNDNNPDLNLGLGKRRIVNIDGAPVREELLQEILTELREWRGNGKRGGSSKNRERPSIKAECYMILRAPVEMEEGETSSRREKRRHKKMEGNKKLWELALQAMKETDSEFATRCSEIAVTFGFTGSPHIDRQNASPFYGLSLGNFTEGTGCVSVECSPRIVAHVNTKNRLGRVDGRYPHWVTSYDSSQERFSLIYYDTLSAYQPPGPAIFTMPQT